MLAGLVKDAPLDVQHQALTGAREELDLVLGGLVGAQQPVLLVAARAIHGRGQDVVQPQHHPGTCGLENPLGARAGMDVAGQHRIGVGEDGLCLIGEDDLGLRAALADEVAVILHVIHAGELMLVLAEQLAVLLERQHVGIGVDALFVDLVQADQLVAHLVGGIGEHQHHLLAALGDAAQADGKSIARQYGEDDAHRAAAQLFPDVLRDVVHGGVVALRAGDDGLGDGDDVAIAKRKTLGLRGLQHAVGDDGGQVVPLADDGAADAAGHRAHSAFIVAHGRSFPFLSLSAKITHTSF